MEYIYAYNCHFNSKLNVIISFELEKKTHHQNHIQFIIPRYMNAFTIRKFNQHKTTEKINGRIFFLPIEFLTIAFTSSIQPLTNISVVRMFVPSYWRVVD